MMDAAQMAQHLKYRLLNAMGIPLWVEKRFSPLSSNNPILGAPLLVLTGMLKVLELEEEALCIAWLDPLKEKEAPIVAKALNRWAPYRVLALGEPLVQFLLKTSKTLDELRLNSHQVEGYESIIEVTYHPVELEKSSECKRKTYQDLLRLKSKIAEAGIV